MISIIPLRINTETLLMQHMSCDSSSTLVTLVTLNQSMTTTMTKSSPTSVSRERATACKLHMTRVIPCSGELWITSTCARHTHQTVKCAEPVIIVIQLQHGIKNTNASATTAANRIITGHHRAGSDFWQWSTDRLAHNNSRYYTVRDPARMTNRVFTRSSKRPANFQQMCSKYTWIAGRLLDRVNTP